MKWFVLIFFLLLSACNDVESVDDIEITMPQQHFITKDPPVVQVQPQYHYVHKEPLPQASSENNIEVEPAEPTSNEIQFETDTENTIDI